MPKVAESGETPSIFLIALHPISASPDKAYESYLDIQASFVD